MSSVPVACVQSPGIALLRGLRRPIGNYACIDPIQRIHAEGFAYRAAVTGPPKVIILVGMWLVFCPFLIMGYAATFEGLHLIQRLTCVGGFLIAAAILFRVTHNFIVKRRAAEQETMEDEV